MTKVLAVPKLQRRQAHSVVGQAAEQSLRDAFGARLKTLMEKAGLNHASLARKSGLDRSAVTRLINAERRVNGDQVVRLARALDVAPGDLWIGPVTTGAIEDPRPVISATYGPMSDPDRSVSRVNDSEGYTVKSDQSEYIARQLDAIPDDALRAEAMEACSRAIRETLHPSELGAGKRGQTAPSGK